MSTKKFKVSFFQGYIKNTEGEASTTIGDVFSRLAETGEIVRFDNKKTVFQIREVYKSGHSFKGVFAKFRSDTLPHIGTQDERSERPIEMTEGEGLLEKNYFLFDNRLNLLTLQTNGHACNSNQIGVLVSSAAQRQVSFNPILRRDAVERVLRDDVVPHKFQLAFAKPKNRDLVDADNFSSAMMTFLSSFGGCSCDIMISASTSGRSKIKGALKDSIKAGLANFSGNVADTRLAKIWFDGESEPVDLIADRIQGTTDAVTMDGKYPEADAMYAALKACKDRHIDEIRAVVDAHYEKKIQIYAPQPA